MPDPASPADPESDKTVSRRDWVSLGAVLFVQTQNAFNDNFVKMVLVGLALAVAAGSAIGENIRFILAALIPIPFILLAPISGFFSDRFSKRSIIVFCLIMQLSIFALIAVAIATRQVQLAIFGYFLLAVQSTIFSPAKFGILKELVGSSRLGFANGLMQMFTMAGILGGMFLGGMWFDSLLKSGNVASGVSIGNAWRAGLIPVLVIGGISLIPLLAARLIEPTPDHPDTKYRHRIWVRHFVHLAYVFKQHVLRVTVLRMAFYWFVANFVALSFFAFGEDLYPKSAEGGAATATARMMLKTGVGLILGSTFVSFLSRTRIRLGLVPIGGFGMALGIVGIGLFEAESALWGFSIGAVGFFSGFFLVPLSALLQDAAEEVHRGRVLSANNLMASLSGVLAILTSKALDGAGLSASGQVLCLVGPLVLVTVFTLGYLRRGAGSKE